jgi:glyoxylase-like metal-dependent hydrolase (beta-lactamase superfamily II)
MITTSRAAPDIDVISSSATIANLGSLAINAFVLHGSEPLLVDTGVVVEADAFMEALRSVVDPATLRWIWLSHPDPDHIGALQRLLAENDQVRVITTFFTTGILGLSGAPLPMERVHLLNPGQRISVGDRTLTAIKPPVYDNPVTTGFYDARSRTLFSADCFGALLDHVPRDASELSAEELHVGQTTWVTIDSSWIHKVDRGTFLDDLQRLRSMEPALVLSGHLPPAPGTMFDRLLDTLADAPDADPFIAPDHAALQAMLSGMPAVA